QLDFPGNVRQLENLCNWITVMAPGQTVEVKDLPQDLIETVPPAGAVAAASIAVPPGVAPAVAVPQPNGALPHTEEKIDRGNWIALLESEAAQMLSAGQPEVMDALGRMFESTVIKAALKHTHGRKNDAAVRLGIGRNTITRKIHELGIDGAKDD
ncbi:MAG: nitrogen regulation protein NR(I), partial [Burkholderiaceae bacterium]|nr:nitrogen regulation protein NR(I) [Burkholderiaceae bacterium]